MTYALGRGIDYYDVETDGPDRRSDREERRGQAVVRPPDGGRSSRAPFQRRRDPNPAVLTQTPTKPASPNPQGSRSMTPTDGEMFEQAQARAASSRRRLPPRPRRSRWPCPTMEFVIAPRWLDAAVARAATRALATSETGVPLADGVPLLPQRRQPEVPGGPRGTGPTSVRSDDAAARRRSRTEGPGRSAAWTTSTRPAARTAPATTPGPAATFLTGVRVKKTAGSDIRAGVSIDQLAARQVGHLTRFPSLELTCDGVRKSGGCDTGYSCAYDYNMSWRTADHADDPRAQPPARLRTPLRRRAGRRASQELRPTAGAAEVDPRLRPRRRPRAVRATARRQATGQKLDEYLTGVREIEARIQQAEKLGEGSADPTPSPPRAASPPRPPRPHPRHVAT